ncbi:MAG: GNAT family N-acetyltransferase [Phycisphaerales bacterium]|nr:MAG: GNAT family N-acetyltransferase [Phycisphaerales bacterium]
MTNLTLHRDSDQTAIALPEPRVCGGSVTVREAKQSDLPFIDALQKKHSKMVGWFPTKQIEANIEGGHVLVAEQSHEGTKAQRDEGNGVEPPVHLVPSCPRASVPQPLGYVIARDTYMKREECGIIYQLNVVPGEHRKLVGATLIKAVFDRAAYGCKLFCCWCAQDIDANHFWESIGFVPLAFRTGARRSKKLGPRIHIFWQRRVRAGDGETPYWFPSQTMGGAVREGRIVLPIPPGTHWSDAKPAVLPGLPANKVAEQLQLESDEERKARKRKRKESKPAPAAKPSAVKRGGLWFGAPASPDSPEASQDEKAAEQAKKAKPRPRMKNDPQYIAAARELRDRYLEQANSGGEAGGLLPGACGKYDVSRVLEAVPSVVKEVRMLDAA